MRRGVKRWWSIGLVLALALPALGACGPGTTLILADVRAAEDINPDFQGRPSPIVVRLYQLKTPVAFSNATYFALYDKEQAELGNDLLGREEFEFRPGQEVKIERELEAQTRYIGILAGYRDIERATWRVVTPVKIEKKNELKIDFRRLAVSASVVD